MDEQRNNKVISRLAGLAGWLVGALALLAFVLSYSSLRHMAETHGIEGPLAYAWPLLLDFAMVVFSLAILRGNLRGERTRYPWLLTVGYAALATAANVLDVLTLGLPPEAIAAAVKAIAPITLVLAFELLMQMVRAEVKRSATTESMAQLRHNEEQLAATVAQQREAAAQLEAGIAQLKAQQAEQQRAIAAQLKDEIAQQKETQLAQLEADVAQRRAQLEAEIAQLAAQREQAQNGQIDPVLVETYQIDGLLAAGLSQRDAARVVGVSEGTLRNRIKNLNGHSLYRRER